MRYSRRASVLLTLALAVSACESVPTAPAPATGTVELSLTAGQTQDRQYVPLLPRLFDQAIAKVKHEKGEEVAAQLAARYTRLRQAARSAHAAGDMETARKRMQEAQAEAARVVSRVFPQAAERVLGMVASKLSTLNARIATAEANGRDVTRIKEVAQRITRLHATASEELRRGRQISALVHATQAADLLASLHDR